MAVAEKVDLVLIAGDFYDGDQRNYRTDLLQNDVRLAPEVAADDRFVFAGVMVPLSASGYVLRSRSGALLLANLQVAQSPRPTFHRPIFDDGSRSGPAGRNASIHA